MVWARYGIALAVFLCASVAPREGAAARAASPEQRLAAAQRAYDRNKFKETIKILTQLLDDANFRDAGDRQRAYLLLGFSHFVMRQETEAARALEWLFR